MRCRENRDIHVKVKINLSRESVKKMDVGVGSRSKVKKNRWIGPYYPIHYSNPVQSQLSVNGRIQVDLCRHNNNNNHNNNNDNYKNNDDLIIISKTDEPTNRQGFSVPLTWCKLPSKVDKFVGTVCLVQEKPQRPKPHRCCLLLLLLLTLPCLTRT